MAIRAKNHRLICIASASLLFTIGLAACSQTTIAARPSVASGMDKPAKLAARAADKAEKAITSGAHDRAVAEAELAVSAMPRDAGYRTLLGRSYLGAGRFASAATSFRDALTLDAGQGRAALSLALAQIALGKPDAARGVIAQHQTIISAADRGLALALAGDSQSAIDLLEAMVRASQSDAQVRQNLALSYALAGRWQEAKLMASYDLAPDMVSKRIMEWAQFARPASASAQVASLLGVTPVADPGQPVRLALVAQPEALAFVAPAPVAPTVAEARLPVVEAVAPVAVAAIVPTNFPIEFATFSGVQFAPRQEVVQPLPAPRAAIPPRSAALVKTGDYVVQIGAYSHLSQVEPAWNRLVDRFASLANFQPSSSVFSRSPGSERYYRLSVGGFDTVSDAAGLCRSIKAQGGTCFVRGVAGDAPLQWASRKSSQIASR